MKFDGIKPLTTPEAELYIASLLIVFEQIDHMRKLEAERNQSPK
jgi:hypothetical protein